MIRLWIDSSDDFLDFVQSKLNPEFVQLETAQLDVDVLQKNVKSEIVQTASAQLGLLPRIVLLTSFSNHVEILCNCRSYEQRLFYMLYANKERLNYRELKRCIANDTFTTLLRTKKNLSIKEVMRLDVAQKKNFAERKNVSVESATNPMKAAATTTFAQTFAQKIRSRFKQESSFKKACDGCFCLMEFVSQNPNVSSGELAESLNLSRRTVATYLKYLVEAEFLKRVGPDKF